MFVAGCASTVPMCVCSTEDVDEEQLQVSATLFYCVIPDSWNDIVK